MDILIRNSIENYNQAIKNGAPSIMELKTINELHEKAEKSALAFFKQSTNSGTPEQNNSAEAALVFVIKSIASAWKPIATELVEQIRMGHPIDCDTDLQEMNKLRQALKKAQEELFAYKNQEQNCELDARYILNKAK